MTGTDVVKGARGVGGGSAAAASLDAAPALVGSDQAASAGPGGEGADARATEPTLGRPRDPEIEARALAAALEVYGKLGWSGFTFGKVAAAARIGKSSLYLRWPTKADLLVAAFEYSDVFYNARSEALAGMGFTEMIRRIVEKRLASYFTPSGLAVVRLSVENQADPESVGEVWERSMGEAVLQTRQLLREGIESGDLRPDTSVVHLGDSLEGAMIMHGLATPTKLRGAARSRLGRYAEELVTRTLGPWLTDQGLQACGFCVVDPVVSAPRGPAMAVPREARQ